MINTERIVPVTAVDLLSLYGLILKVGNVSVTALAATDIEGDFSTGAGTFLADQPVQSLDFTGTTGTVYFVAAYDYVGFTRNGAAVTMAGDTVNPDGRTLYKAVLASNTVTISTVGF